MPMKLFGDTYAILEKSMNLRSQRHTVISANIANAETPNYKAVKVDFEDELKKVVPDKNQLNLKVTSTRHVTTSSRIEDVRATPTIEKTEALRADENTVDLDKEFVALSKNKLMYDVSTEIISRKLKGLLTAIKESK